MASEKSAQDVAIERQGAFENYVVVLTFTLLGLSVQTAKLGTWIGADVAEISGWGVLLFAGLSGLRRLEKVPDHYRLQDLKQGQERVEYESAKIALTDPRASAVVAQTGERVRMADHAAKARANVETIKDELRRHDDQLVRLYWIQRRGLPLGIVLIIVARAMPAIAHVLNFFRIHLL